MGKIEVLYYYLLYIFSIDFINIGHLIQLDPQAYRILQIKINILKVFSNQYSANLYHKPYQQIIDMTKSNIFKVSGQKGPSEYNSKQTCYPNTKYSHAK